MHEVHEQREESRLAALFSGALALPEDDGFSGRVRQRIRRRTWIRRAVLAGAVIVGALVALQPTYELAQVAGESMGHVLSQLGWTGGSGDYRILALGLLAAILSPLVVSMLEE